VQAARGAHIPMLTHLAFSKPIVFESDSDLSSQKNNDKTEVPETMMIDDDIKEQDENVEQDSLSEDSDSSDDEKMPMDFAKKKKKL